MAILDLQGLALEDGAAARRSRRSRRCGGGSRLSLALC
ncbi:MAG: SapB/AmfS family lantipeptide [Geodermatophilaceae bacterium]|nr:SapB/AmfS family lantipeptide [Geodermatophilaceae bacterium]